MPKPIRESPTGLAVANPLLVVAVVLEPVEVELAVANPLPVETPKNHRDQLSMTYLIRKDLNHHKSSHPQQESPTKSKISPKAEKYSTTFLDESIPNTALSNLRLHNQESHSWFQSTPPYSITLGLAENTS